MKTRSAISFLVLLILSGCDKLDSSHSESTQTSTTKSQRINQIPINKDSKSVALYSSPQCTIPEEGKEWIVSLNPSNAPGQKLMMKFVPIPAGSFLMGSNNGEPYEKPVHHVTLTKTFWLTKTEVTIAQFSKIMGVRPADLMFANNEQPISYVSWTDALDFCAQLTEHERNGGRLSAGFKYTLPTEAQWEYACRAGTTGDYAGSVDAMGWHLGNSNFKNHTVGLKRANAWGLHDMYGNVWEWCMDHCKISKDYFNPSRNYVSKGVYIDGIVDPVCTNGSYRIMRGGGYDCYGEKCRSSVRYYVKSSLKGNNVGFRVCLIAVSVQ